jgi:cytoskeletal protein CcmA (bactofilin family)
MVMAPVARERKGEFADVFTQMQAQGFVRFRIDGKVVGNIETIKDNKVTVAIGATGEVSGDITAYRVMVAGKVEGNIYAAERVEFHKDSVVHGDISYGSIAIEHGAHLAQ